MAIDVSEYQGAVDWQKVYDSGVRHAYVKAGQLYADTGYRFDAQFTHNLAEARRAGVEAGVYWFASPGQSPLVEARWFVRNVVPLLHDGELPPALDLETTAGHDWPYLDHWKATWLAAVDAAVGCRAAFYSYYEYWRRMTLYPDRPVWGADLRAGFTPPSTWFLHQHSFTGRVRGISGDVDLDHFLHDVPRIAKGV